MPKMLLLQMLLRSSPSTRREWIEIAASNPLTSAHGVSLHTEGVD